MSKLTGICSKCGGEHTGSHSSYCKACFAEYARNRYQANPEKGRAASAKWAAANPGQNQKRYAKDPEKWNEYHRQWRAENPESRKVTRRKGHLKSLYGISIKDFEAMMYEQGNCCAICGSEMTVGTRGNQTACVDHDHDTGEVRALLCALCNAGLGSFKDNPDLMLAAAAYVLRHELTRKD